VNYYSFHIVDRQWGHLTIKDIRACAVRHRWIASPGLRPWPGRPAADLLHLRLL